MAKKNKDPKQAEAQLIRAFREETALGAHPVFDGETMKGEPARWSYRLIEKYLNEKIPAGLPGVTTFASIWDWEIGKHPVTAECLQAWMMYYPAGDLRHQLAVNVFALRMKKHAHVVGAGLVEYDAESGKKLLKAVRVKGAL